MNTVKNLNRRDFIRTSAALGVTLSIPLLAQAGVNQLAKPVKIGLISDIHHDIVPDGKTRLARFVQHIRQRNVDGILQMGDFAFPEAKNKEVIDLFNQAHPTHLHVIGNHDVDGGQTREQVVEGWGMPGRYYVQQINGIWLIVLDGNDPGSPTHKGGYPAYINPAQTSWLKAKLQELDGPIIVVSHQPLIGTLSVDNAAEIRDILASAAEKIIVAINGHSHIDQLMYDRKIPYLTINSASYVWVGDKFKHESYPKEIHQKHPSLASTCPYQDPLFTVLTIDPATLTIQLEGRRTKWVGKSPEELGFGDTYKPLKIGQEIVPFIRERKVIRISQK
ncbi:hypothetical protein GCM10028807_49150 [Spirosoma daeguense]